MAAKTTSRSRLMLSAAHKSAVPYVLTAAKTMPRSRRRLSGRQRRRRLWSASRSAKPSCVQQPRRRRGRTSGSRRPFQAQFVRRPATRNPARSRGVACDERSVGEHRQVARRERHSRAYYENTQEEIWICRHALDAQNAHEVIVFRLLEAHEASRRRWAIAHEECKREVQRAATSSRVQ
mmetsp:Transcript_12480/g.37645  ORF Transcript_12480/g.37645 Transcript_12480/m.37645 type:complete len:179 (+) Transcript_12480:309-845(+)